MNPGLFDVLKASAAVTALLGDNPLRVYPWGRAPEKGAQPYATWGVYSGTPENTLDQVPKIDNLGTQINVWAESVESCNNCFGAIRDALEPLAHMTNFSAATWDRETGLFTARLDFDFWTER